MRSPRPVAKSCLLPRVGKLMLLLGYPSMRGRIMLTQRRTRISINLLHKPSKHYARYCAVPSDKEFSLYPQGVGGLSYMGKIGVTKALGI